MFYHINPTYCCPIILSNISNSLETNISIVDFSSMRETINAMAENGFKVKRTAETPQEFTEEQS